MINAQQTAAAAAAAAAAVMNKSMSSKNSSSSASPLQSLSQQQFRVISDSESASTTETAAVKATTSGEDLEINNLNSEIISALPKAFTNLSSSVSTTNSSQASTPVPMQLQQIFSSSSPPPILHNNSNNINSNNTNQSIYNTSTNTFENITTTPIPGNFNAANFINSRTQSPILNSMNTILNSNLINNNNNNGANLVYGEINSSNSSSNEVAYASNNLETRHATKMDINVLLDEKLKIYKVRLFSFLIFYICFFFSKGFVFLH